MPPKTSPEYDPDRFRDALQAAVVWQVLEDQSDGGCYQRPVTSMAPRARRLMDGYIRERQLRLAEIQTATNQIRLSIRNIARAALPAAVNAFKELAHAMQPIQKRQRKKYRWTRYDAEGNKEASGVVLAYNVRGAKWLATRTWSLWRPLAWQYNKRNHCWTKTCRQSGNRLVLRSLHPLFKNRA